MSREDVDAGSDCQAAAIAEPLTAPTAPAAPTDPAAPTNTGPAAVNWWSILTALTGVCLIAAGAVLVFIPGHGDPLAFPGLGGMGVLLLLGSRTLPHRIRTGDTSGIRERIDNEAAEMPQTADAPRVTVSGRVEGSVNIQMPEARIDAATRRASDAIGKQEAILREIYTQGLEQSRLSFRVSLVFASLGSCILLYGVFLAVNNATTDGQQYSSIVTGLTGVVINMLSGLFFLQSNRARRSMGEQGVMLREESREDRRIATARELAATVVDQTLRDAVRAEIAKQLIAKTLEPKTTESSKGTDSADENNKTT